jgi:hypothetical protein
MAQQLRWAQELQGVLCKFGSLLDRPIYPSNRQSLTSLLPILLSPSTLFFLQLFVFWTAVYCVTLVACTIPVSAEAMNIPYVRGALIPSTE